MNPCHRPFFSHLRYGLNRVGLAEGQRFRQVLSQEVTRMGATLDIFHRYTTNSTHTRRHPLRWDGAILVHDERERVLIASFPVLTVPP